MIARSKLKNGFTIIKIPQHDTAAVTVMLLVPVGSRYETKTNNGISHFLEHLMFKGTVKRPTTLDISKALDGVGAEYNAYTSKDHTLYYIKAAAEHLELTLDLLSDMLFHSVFDAKEIDKERGVILEEINMYEDNPLMHLDTLLEMSVFGKDNPLGYDIAGLKPNIRNLPRATFVQYKQTHYSPRTMCLCVAGKLNQATDKLIARYFGSQPATNFTNKIAKRFIAKQTQPQIFHQQKDTQQTQLGVGVIGLPLLHKDLPALQVLSVILGGNMSSRLFVNIREKQGLCYFIRTEVNPYVDSGIFSIQAGLDKTRLQEALKSLMCELKQIKAEPVTNEELNNAKEYIKGQMALRFEDSSALAMWYGRQAVLTGKFVAPQERIKQINQVTVTDIQRIANQLFITKRLNIASIGSDHSTHHLKRLLAL
ncbi:MAG: pitrilysin family protein [Patescibacteria group bacterium]|jgi:predicted Zn-dependent peptidase